MDKELKTKWVDALRSGKYVQGKKMLLTDAGERCCLGVLCDVLGKNEGALHNSLRWPSMLQDVVPQGESVTLTSMNDKGTSFAEIAHYIEANL